MPRVRVWVELTEDHMRGFEGEAARRNVPVEDLVGQCVNRLVKDLEQEEEEGGCPMIPS